MQGRTLHKITLILSQNSKGNPWTNVTPRSDLDVTAQTVCEPYGILRT